MNNTDIYAAAQMAAAMLTGPRGKLPAGALKLKGQVDTINDLPETDNTDGDVYIVGTDEDTDKAEYYWFNDQWNYLGETPVDLSDYVKKTDYANTNESIAGIIKTSTNLGLYANGNNGMLNIYKASDLDIMNGTQEYKPIVPSNSAKLFEVYGISSRNYIADLATSMPISIEQTDFDTSHDPNTTYIIFPDGTMSHTQTNEESDDQ